MLQIYCNGPYGVHGNPRVCHRDLWLFMQGDRTSCVQSNGIPYELSLLCWDATILEERPGGISSIDFKSIPGCKPVGQAKIVKDC